MLEAVLKSSSVVICSLIFIGGIYVFAAHFPEEGMELIIQTVFLHIVKHTDLIYICHEVLPDTS